MLFELDIKKAFDSVRWDFLMDMLHHNGFPRVLLNGLAGDLIKHGKGLR